MGDLFSQKKQTAEVTEVADPYKSVREPYLSWLSGQIGKTGPSYTGEMTAPMSDQEKQSLDWLKSYSAGGPSATRTAATAEINKTVGGQYDPTTSPYYQAVKAEAARNQKEAQESIADQAAGGGRYWTGARLKVQGNEAGKTTNYLNEILGTLSEAERQRMIQVLPYAQQFANEEEQAPLQKATALQTLGALPRNIQQAQDTAAQNQWQQSVYQYPMDIAQLAGGMAQNGPTYAPTTYAPSAAQQMAPWLGQAAQALMFSNLFNKGGTTSSPTPGQLQGWLE